MSTPNTTDAGKLAPGIRSAADTLMKRVFHTWLAGARLLGRFLWFTFNLLLAMLPLNLLAGLFASRETAIFADGRFHPHGILMLIAFVIYAPFACLLAARVSRQRFFGR